MPAVHFGSQPGLVPSICDCRLPIQSGVTRVHQEGEPAHAYSFLVVGPSSPAIEGAVVLNFIIGIFREHTQKIGHDYARAMKQLRGIMLHRRGEHSPKSVDEEQALKKGNIACRAIFENLSIVYKVRLFRATEHKEDSLRRIYFVVQSYAAG